MQASQPSPGWRPTMGDRVIIVATNRAAAVTAELPRDRFEVEPVPQIRLTALEPDEKYEVYHLSELRQASPPH